MRKVDSGLMLHFATIGRRGQNRAVSRIFYREALTVARPCSLVVDPCMSADENFKEVKATQNLSGKSFISYIGSLSYSFF